LHRTWSPPPLWGFPHQANPSSDPAWPRYGRSSISSRCHNHPNDAAQRYLGSTSSAKGSLNHLDIWLREQLGSERYAAATSDAVKTIRDIRYLRNEGSHPDPAVRAKAIKARRSLGLPDVVADWAGTWEQIKSKAAGAFDIIRQEVLGAPVSLVT
jgi:hypothetical protein